jgi:ABC-2 type transport system permease protein
MQEVSAVCDTVMIIDKGKLILSDKPENLSTRLGATGGMKLSVKGGKEAVMEALRSISRISKLEEHDPVEEGVVELTVHYAEKEDIREEVFYAMCKANLPILEMQSIRMSLEDIFLKVTNGDAKFDINTDSTDEDEEKASVSESTDAVRIMRVRRIIRMLAIYKKELRTYFTSMIGYVFMAFLLVIIGIYFFIQNLLSGYADFEYTLSGVMFLTVLLTPILTMRLMAEENKQKTDQLLYTSPLTAMQIVMGKFLAVFTVFLSVVAVTCFYPLIIRLYGKISLAPAYAGIFGFVLLGGAYLAIGLFISSMTESQVVAAVVSFIVFLFTVLMNGIANAFPTDNKTAYIIFTVLILIVCLALYLLMRNLTLTVGIGFILEFALTGVYLLKPTWFDGSVVKVFNWVSVTSRFDQFSYGIFNLSSIVYYLSIIFLFTFLTTQVIKKKRWS